MLSGFDFQLKLVFVFRFNAQHAPVVTHINSLRTYYIGGFAYTAGVIPTLSIHVEIVGNGHTFASIFAIICFISGACVFASKVKRVSKHCRYAKIDKGTLKLLHFLVHMFIYHNLYRFLVLCALALRKQIQFPNKDFGEKVSSKYYLPAFFDNLVTSYFGIKLEYCTWQSKLLEACLKVC